MRKYQKKEHGSIFSHKKEQVNDEKRLILQVEYENSIE
jgi:hypothetical protein